MSTLAYTLPQVADQLGKSEHYVRGLIRDSKIPAKRVGKSHVILAADFLVFLEALPDSD
jgi:excisionase family DNA binding protein